MNTVLKFILEYFLIVGGVSLFKAFGWLGLASIAWPAVWAVGLAWLFAAVVVTIVFGLLTVISE